MNNLVASLCHFLAVACVNGGCYRITAVPSLCEAMPRAKELGLVESPTDINPKLDQYWIRLTEKGRNAVSESICVMSEVA